jgi:hypothetical protein
VGYHRRGYRALCEGYLRALREDGSDDLSSFNAKTIRRKTKAGHASLVTERDISDSRAIYGL